MRRQLDYLCLQPTREGQASYAHVTEIVTGLRRRGWDVRMIEPSLPRPGGGDGVRRALATATAQLGHWWRFHLRLARFVYIRTHFAALPTALLAKATGAIVVQEVNGPAEDAYDAWPQLRRLHALILFSLRVQLRLADAVIVVTPGLARYVADLTGRRRGYHVVGNGADVERFVPETKLAERRGTRYVVFVGALASWQGIDVAVDALASRAWPSDVHLVVAGDGVERNRVLRASERDPRIRWLGTIHYDEVAGLVAGSMAALVPMTDVPRSRFGLSPLKLFEAMACGVPVIASDLPGLAEPVRDHDCGVTFTAGDSDSLGRAVATLAADPATAAEMGARGRAAAVALYSWDALADQTERVLRRAADRPTEGPPRPLAPLTD